MAVIACRECTQTVSSEAPRCPHCGIPSPGKKRKGLLSRLGTVVVLAIAALGFLGFLGSAIPGKPDTTTPKQKAENEAAMSGVLGLRESMRNPQSFQLRLGYIAPDGTPCYVFRAQNGFGGLNEDIALALNGKVLVGNSAEKPWIAHCKNAGGRNETELLKVALEEIPLK